MWFNGCDSPFMEFPSFVLLVSCLGVFLLYSKILGAYNSLMSFPFYISEYFLRINFSTENFLMKGYAAYCQIAFQNESCFQFPQQCIRGQLFLGFSSYLKLSLLGEEVKEGSHRLEDALLPRFSSMKGGCVYKQLLLLWFLAGHHGAISGHGCPHHWGHPHVRRVLLWVWFGEETATEIPRGCA